MADWTSASVAFAPLDAETREPPQRGAFESTRLRFVNHDADPQGVAQVDVRQLARRAADDRHVARLQGPAEAGIGRSLTRIAVGTAVAGLGRVSAVGRGHELLLAMPSVAEESTPEGGREVVLRWVGVHAEDAPRALKQVVDVFARLASAMRLSPQRVRCEAYEER
jgi:hypothetical protein